MLYQLIVQNPYKDITLHVSANNPAMVRIDLFIRQKQSFTMRLQLLYNRFGFKAEEFVAGFYKDYVDPNSRTSTNAFRLRLRR